MFALDEQKQVHCYYLMQQLRMSPIWRFLW